jgi:hypothetical protein
VPVKIGPVDINPLVVMPQRESLQKCPWLSRRDMADVAGAG